MEEKAQNGRVISFDVLRIIAAFAVVWLHISAQRFYDCFPTNEWIIRNFYDSLVRWSVPIFIMISGALFLDATRKLDIKKLYTKNVTRIILIFLFWSVIYAIYSGISGKGYSDMARRIIQGPFHFWFLKMLIGLYIVVPILRLVVLEKKTELYFIILAILSTFIIPMFFPVIKHFNSIIGAFLENYYNSFEIKIATGYVGYFVLGHYLSNYSLCNIIKKSIYAFGILSIFAVFLLTYYVSNYIGTPSTTYYNYLNVFTLFEASALFVYVKEHVTSSKYDSLLTKASKMSLGVYIIHILIIYIFYDVFRIDSSLINPIIFIPCFSMLVFVLSYVIVAILIRLPIIKRFIL